MVSQLACPLSRVGRLCIACTYRVEALKEYPVDSEGRLIVKWYSRYRAFSVLLQRLIPYTSHPGYRP